MKKFLLLALLVPVLVMIPIGQEVFATTTTDLYSCDSPLDGGNQIHKIDKTDGTIISSANVTVTLAGGTYDGCNGLAVDPTTRQMYMIANRDTTRTFLTTIDPATGIATSLGATNIAAFALDTNSITFDHTGQLYATASGVESGAVDKLYYMDKTNALALQGWACTFNSAPVTDYPIITYNYDTEEMFYINGDNANVYYGIINSTEVEEGSLFQGTCEESATNSDYLNSDYQDGFAYDTVTGLYYFLNHFNVAQDFVSLTGAGVTNEVGSDIANGFQHGLAFAIVATQPDPVNDLSTSSIADTNVGLQWTEPNLQGGILQEYTVRYTTPHGTPDTFFANTTSTSILVTGLTAETDYSFTVDVTTEVSSNLGGNIIDETTIATPSGSGITSDKLYSCDNPNDGGNQIHELDTTNGAVLSSVTVSGLASFGGCNDMTTDPTDGQMYIIANDGNRNIATIDPVTGVGSYIGEMTYDNSPTFSSWYGKNIWFDSTGQMFTTESNTNGTPEYVYKVDKATGIVDTNNLYCEFTGGYNNAYYGFMTLNYDTGDMYYIDGDSTDIYLGTIDETGTGGTCQVGELQSDANVVGDLPEYQMGLAYNTVTGEFYMIDDNVSTQDLLSMTLAGATTQLSTDTYATQRGLSFSLVLGDIPPDPVDDLISTGQTTSSVSLAWTEPTLNGVLEDYTVRYTTPFGTPDTFYANTTNTNITVSGLTQGTNYSFTVDITTDNGSNLLGNIVNTQTGAPPPPFEYPVTTTDITTTNTMYSCTSAGGSDNNISIMDKADGTIISSNQLSITGNGTNPVAILGSEGCLGLSQDPTTEIWYALIRETGGGSGDNWLATVNPITGVGEAVGKLPVAYQPQSIAFDSTGKLYGYHNSNGLDDLFQISKTTARQEGMVCSNDFGSASPSTLAYNWDTDEMYVLAQITTATPTAVAMRIYDMPLQSGVCSKTDVAVDISHASWGGDTTAGDPQSMAYNTDDGLFYAHSKSFVGQEDQYFSITPTAPFNSIRISDKVAVGLGSEYQRGIGFPLSVTAFDPPNISTTDLYSCDNPNDGGNEIHKIDKTDGTIISSQTITIPTFAQDGCLGLATDPTDGQMYAIIRDGDRYLVSIDPTTGVGTNIGEFTYDNSPTFSSWYAKTISFDIDGQLYTTESDTNGNAYEFYKVDKTTGIVDSNNLLCSFGVPSNDGYTTFHTLNYDTGRMSYVDTGGDYIFFGDIDTTFAGEMCELTSIETDRGEESSYGQGLAYDTDTGNYFFLDHYDEAHDFLEITPLGVTTELGTASHDGIQKGMTFAISLIAEVPDPVSDLISTGQTTTSVDLAWTQPNLNNGILQEYTVRYTTPFGTPDTFFANTTNTNIEVTGLTTDGDYSFTVDITSDIGSNLLGNILNQTVGGSPDPVSDLISGNATTGTMDLSWTQPDMRGGIFQDYTVRYTTPFGTPDTFYANTTNTSITLNPLLSGSEYSFTVDVTNNIGTNALGNIVNNSTVAFPPTIDTDKLYSCDNPSDGGNEIHLLNQTDGTIISSQTITVSGLPTLDGCLGLAVDPLDGQMYAIIRDGDRYLVTIDPTTGVGNSISNFLYSNTISDWYARSIGFDSSGQLYTTESNTNGYPNELYKVDKATVIVDSDNLYCEFTDIGNTPFHTLNYDTGEMIFVNTDSSDFYFGVINATGVGGACEQTNILTNRGSEASYGQGLAYDTVTGDSFFLDHYDEAHDFLQITPAGVVTEVGTAAHDGLQKGLAFSVFVTPAPVGGVPAITLIGDENIEADQHNPASYVEYGATCVDIEDGALIPTVDISGIDFANIGTYEVYYDCVDTEPNSAPTVTRFVTIISTAPVITLIGDVNIEAQQHTPASYVEYGATCFDTPDGAIIPTIDISGIDFSKTGTYEVIYTCVDSDLEVDTESRFVTITIFPSHIYTFDGHGNDSLGGESFTFTDGGTGLDANGWNFEVGDFATLKNSIPQYEYAIEMVLTFDDSDPNTWEEWNQIIEYHNWQTSGNFTNEFGNYNEFDDDTGIWWTPDDPASLYIECTECDNEEIYNLTFNDLHHIIVQRNATSSEVNMWIDGIDVAQLEQGVSTHGWLDNSTSILDPIYEGYPPEFIFDQPNSDLILFGTNYWQYTGLPEYMGEDRSEFGHSNSEWAGKGYINCLNIFSEPMTYADAINITTLDSKSKSVQCSNQDPTAPSNPVVNLNVTNVQEYQADLTWEEPFHEGDLVEYEVKVSTPFGIPVTTFATTTNSFITPTDLFFASDYSFDVVAITSSSTPTGLSNIVNFTTLGVPQSVFNLFDQTTCESSPFNGNFSSHSSYDFCGVQDDLYVAGGFVYNIASNIYLSVDNVTIQDTGNFNLDGDMTIRDIVLNEGTITNNGTIQVFPLVNMTLSDLHPAVFSDDDFIQSVLDNDGVIINNGLISNEDNADQLSIVDNSNSIVNNGQVISGCLSTYLGSNPTVNARIVEGCFGLIDSFPLDVAWDLSTAIRTDFPLPFHVGLYDSSNNLIGSYSGEVTTTGVQNAEATFNSPIPADGLVSVGVGGNNINWLGDDTPADFSSSTLPSTFTIDGSTNSSQRTLITIFHPDQNTPDEENSIEKFEQAKNVALTVIGVLPIALFFVLFTMLSGKVDGEGE